MTWQGDKWVCGKCHSWYVPGFTAVLLPVGVTV